jgi:hypothetical protein
MVTLLQDSMPRSLVIWLNNFGGNCCLHFDDTLKEDVPEGGGSRFSKTLLPIHQTARCYVLEYGNLRNGSVK